MTRPTTQEDWLGWLASSEPRALAWAATAIEDRQEGALAAVERLPTGQGIVVGVTGPPGAGKSTLVNLLAKAYRREGKSVAILAVDPSSELTGGAILGDRIRMQDLSGDRQVFIRSMASRGAHGGLAEAARDVVRLFLGCGKDVVLVETVGVGQSEIDISRLADVTLVLLVPGMGDDVQALKAGILEIADVYVINKADRPGAQQLENELRNAQSLGDGGDIAIVKTIAAEGIGVTELISAVEGAAAFRRQTVFGS